MEDTAEPTPIDLPPTHLPHIDLSGIEGDALTNPDLAAALERILRSDGIDSAFNNRL